MLLEPLNLFDAQLRADLPFVCAVPVQHSPDNEDSRARHPHNWEDANLPGWSSNVQHFNSNSHNKPLQYRE